MLDFHCKMQRITRVAICMALLIAGSLWKVFPAQAIELGKTYDKSNYQEIEDLLIPPMLNWVKKGEYVIKTGALNCDFARNSKYFTEATKKNAGKYDIGARGLLVHKDSGELVTFLNGHPFPEIDPNDPRIADKIMENHSASMATEGSTTPVGDVRWVGKGGFERNLITGGTYLYYWQRKDDPIPNPSGFRGQDMIDVIFPYDYRGTVMMSWSYIDERETSSFMYLPMVRRVRRGSGAAGSDPFMGSDMCLDDPGGYGGRNYDMEFKLLGEKTILCSFESVEENILKMLPDGTVEKKFYVMKYGYEIPGFQGAPWCAPDMTYVPRECLVMEMNPKDPYYNYGKQILYIDKAAYTTFYKVIWNRAGEYWKTVVISASMAATKGDEYRSRLQETMYGIDDKTHHATVSPLVPYSGRPYYLNLPQSRLSTGFFTTANMIQLSK